MNLATEAAFTASGVALIIGVFSVVWGARLSSRAQLEQWRRNEVRPIVARVLTLSEDARAQWIEAWGARQKWEAAMSADPDRGPETTKAGDEARDQWKAGSELYGKLRFETAQLDLFAGRPVRDVAAKLVRAHESPQHWLRPASGASDLLRTLTEHDHKIAEVHVELVAKAREDLGLAAQ